MTETSAAATADLDELSSRLEFLRGIEALKSTLRSAHTASGRVESAAEHSWRLAMLAWATFDLLREEGLCMGLSTGINVAGAIRLARALGPGHTIVTVLCDYGSRYQSKLFNPSFLREKGLPTPDWLEAGAGGTPPTVFENT